MDARYPRSLRLFLPLTLAAGATVLALSLVGLAALDSSDAGEQATPDAARQRPSTFSMRSERPRPAPCAFELGGRMAYAVTSHTTLELDMDGAARSAALSQAGANAKISATPARHRDLEREWRLELEVVAREADAGTSVLAAQILDRGSRSLVGDQTPRPSPHLDDTFLIRVDERCAITEFGWRSEGDLDAAREQQILAAGLGFVAPATRGEPSRYGASGFDTTGSYHAQFDYAGDDTLRGELVSFAASAAEHGGARVDIELLGSSIEAELRPGWWFGHLKHERDLELSWFGANIGAHYRMTHARAVELGDFAPRVDLDDGGWSFGLLGPRPDAESARADFDPALVGVPLGEVLERCRTLIAEGSVGDYAPLMRGWLRANPSGADELLALIRDDVFADEQIAFGVMFSALGSANTPQAQSALLELLGADEAVAHQIASAHALAMVDAPSARMVATLYEASSREGLHAIERGSLALAMGNFASRSEAHDPEVAAAARAQIQAWLDTPGEQQQLSHSLLAAGNAGHDAFVPSIAAHLDHEDVEVRRSAVEALRNMSPEAAYPELERGMQDEDRVIRTSALQSATSVALRHDHEPSPELTRLAGAALDSESEAERGAALSLLREAAKRGDSRADAMLRARLDAQLGAEQRDTEAIVALGNSMGSTWKAPE